MKIFIILIGVTISIMISGCSTQVSKNTEEEILKEEQIMKSVDEQKEEMVGKIGISEENEIKEEQNVVKSNDASINNIHHENRKVNVSEYQLTIPKKYTRVNHNDHIYVYDENGNSLNISIQSSKIKVDEYSEKNYHRLISSTYKDATLNDLRHMTLDGLKTLYIEYAGMKNDKNVINCRYFVENEGDTILIDLQAIDEANCKILKSIVEQIKF